MMKLKPSEIKWPEDRIRQDYGDMEELEKSIADDTLGQPITVTRDNVLIDGGRRLKAHQARYGDKPIEVFVNESPLPPTIMEIHMEANTKKFTPEENYRAGQELEKYYENKKNQGQRNDLTSPQNRAEVIGSIDEKVSDDLNIGETTYRAVKRVFEPKAEEKVGKEKANEFRKLANTKSINAAYEALKEEENRIANEQIEKEHPKPEKDIVTITVEEQAFIEELDRVIRIFKKAPKIITEPGREHILKQIAVIQEWLDKVRS